MPLIFYDIEGTHYGVAKSKQRKKYYISGERERHVLSEKIGGIIMEEAILKVEGMSCEHCVKAVQKAVGTLPGVENVLVDLKSKTVTLKYNPAQSTLDRIKEEVEDQGYDVID